MDLLAVITTVANAEQADALARAAVEQRLAACVQTEPIRSTYRWQARIACDDEVRLTFKTTQARYAELEALLHTLHPYELPAIYAVPVTVATHAYAEWVCDAVRAAPP